MTFQDAEHAGELLSALVDGELADDEADRVLAHVELCPTCAHELDLLERARSALRALPELEPPADFIEGIVRRRHRILVYGTAGGLIAAVAMVVLAVTTQVSPELDVEPQLVAFEDDHSTTAVTAPSVPTTLTRTSEFAEVEVENEIAGLTLVSVEETDAAVHALYRDGDQVVSLFQQPGSVDWSALPAEGERFRLGRREAWQVADHDALVLEADGVVVTLVGGDADTRSAMARGVPDAPRRDWFDKAHDACQQIVRAFGLR